MADEQWSENIYYQYFCGLEYHKKRKPCASSDLVHFRKRIGEKGARVILQASIQIHDKTENDRKGKEEEVVYADTTVQEKNMNLGQSLVFCGVKNGELFFREQIARMDTMVTR